MSGSVDLESNNGRYFLVSGASELLVVRVQPAPETNTLNSAQHCLAGREMDRDISST